MKKLCSVLGLVFLLAACHTPQPVVNPPPDIFNGVPQDIPNLRVVRVGVYRSGQPGSTNAWNYLRYRLGVTNAVKLNTESEGSADYAETIGITVHRFPIPWYNQTFLRPSFNLVSNAVYAITPNTLVFCEHGQDRTGLIVASERVWIEHWSKQAAWTEAEDCGFHDVLHGLSDFFEDSVK